MSIAIAWHYLVGNTYPIKDAIREAGCKWDADARCWYTGKRDRAEELVAKVASVPAADPKADRPAPGPNAVVAGKATYKGRSYYLAGREVVRTAYDRECQIVGTRDGSKWLLYATDGSFQFWASRAEVQIAKTYQRAQTIGGLRDYAAKARAAGGAEELAEQRAERSGTCRGCRGPIRDARHHAAMGGYCGSCAFDEYDC